MKLLVNHAAAYRSSLGVRRYFDNVSRHLRWPGGVQLTSPPRWRRLDRLTELTLRGSEESLLWSPAQRGPLRARNHVVTVHDCINVEYTYIHDWRLTALHWMSQQLLQHARCVVAISNATRDAVLRNYRLPASQVVVIQSSCQVEMPGSEAINATPLRAPPYVLMVTNALPHKNTVRACQALIAAGLVRRGMELRVIGSIADEARELCRAAAVELHFGHGVDDASLVAWYRGARFLLSASLSEGHNLPIAEALSLGVEVLCSDIPAHREFYAGQVDFFPPEDVDAMAAAVEQAFERSSPWPKTAPPSERSFADVAADYQQLFASLS